MQLGACVKIGPKKFRLVMVSSQPCPPEEAEKHLCAFARSFIDKAYTDRWLYILLEKPEKARRMMVKFEQQLDLCYCQEVDTVDLLPVSLSEKYGMKSGVYFDGSRLPIITTATDPVAAWFSHIPKFQ